MLCLESLLSLALNSSTALNWESHEAADGREQGLSSSRMKRAFVIPISDSRLGHFLGCQSEINGANTLPVRNRGKGPLTQSSTIIPLVTRKEETCSTSVKVHGALEQNWKHSLQQHLIFTPDVDTVTTRLLCFSLSADLFSHGQPHSENTKQKITETD